MTTYNIGQAQNTAYACIHTLAGYFPGYEEAIRALFAEDGERFGKSLPEWPADISDHAMLLAENSLTLGFLQQFVFGIR